MDQTTELKTYALLKHTEGTVPIFQRIDKDKRVRFKNRVIDHAYLRATFFDPKEKKNRTIRLKLNSNFIDQDKQVKEELILANEPFTFEEKKAVEFRNGILMTNLPIVQQFLEASPQFSRFTGTSADIKETLYELIDKKAEIKSKNKDFLRTLEAATKVAEVYKKGDLKEAQDLMIRLNGSFFTPPNDMDEILAELTKFVDDADDRMLDKLLAEDHTEDEKITILIARAVNEKIISFEQVENEVVRIDRDKPVTLREIPSSYDKDERKRYFAAFLSSEEGHLLAQDLQDAIDEKTGGKVKGARKKKEQEQVT